MERPASTAWSSCALSHQAATSKLFTTTSGLSSLQDWFEQQQDSWVKSSQVPSKLVCVATKCQGRLLSIVQFISVHNFRVQFIHLNVDIQKFNIKPLLVTLASCYSQWKEANPGHNSSDLSCVLSSNKMDCNLGMPIFSSDYKVSLRSPGQTKTSNC